MFCLYFTPNKEKNGSVLQIKDTVEDMQKNQRSVLQGMYMEKEVHEFQGQSAYLCKMSP